MQDSEIVALYFARDEAAIMATQDKYGAYLFKIAHNILADDGDSEESVSDTCLAAWNSIPPHRPDVLRTYLAKLARRIAISLFRRRTRKKRQASEYALSLEELSETADRDTPESAMEAELLGQSISAFLRTLSERERGVFLGRYFYLDPLAEIARYAGMSEAAVKSMLHRQRTRLRAYLEKEGFSV